MRLYFTYLLCLIGFILAGCSSEEDNAVDQVATIGSYVISADDFRVRFAEYILTTGLPDDARNRKQFLNTLVAAKQMVLEAKDEGVMEREAYRFASERYRKKLLVESYLKHTLYDSLQISDAVAEQFFMRANTTIEARHLYAASLEEASQLYERLHAGETFEDLAAEVFEDPNLKASGGSVGSFTVDEMDPAFEDRAFALAVGEISEPVRTRTGYSIIQVQDRFVKPLVTESEFAEKKDNVMQYARYRLMTRARESHQAELLEALDPAFDERGFNRLLDQILGTELIPLEEEAQLDLALVQFRRGTDNVQWTLGTFRDVAQFTSDDQRARVRSAEDLMAFVHGLLLREEMVYRAEEAGLDKQPVFVEALEEVMEDWIWDDATKQFLSGIEVPEDSSRAYFASYGHEFEEPTRVHVWELLLEDASQAAEMQKRLQSESFEALAATYSVRQGADQARGYLGALDAEQLGFWAVDVFSSKEGAILGPREVAGKFILLKIGSTVPARSLTFDEALPEIEKRYRRRHMQIRLKAHLEMLETRYPVSTQDSLLYAVSLKEKPAPASLSEM